ncbi:MAG: hypothetical protein ABJA67_01805 [Chthonomonadales bacterium]
MNAIAALCSLVALSVVSPIQVEDFGAIKSAKISIVKSSVPKYYQHGNLIVDFAKKKYVNLNSTETAMDVKIFPGRHTIGWIEGKMDKYREDDWFFPKTLVIWRNGKVVRKFDPGRFFVGWGLVESGKKIAVATAGMHGPTYMFLYDLESGKELDHAANFDRKRKSWVKSIPEHGYAWYN